MIRPRLFAAFAVLAAALTLVLSSCGGEGGEPSPAGPTKIVVLNGYADAQGENFTALDGAVQQGTPRRRGEPIGLEQ